MHTVRSNQRNITDQKGKLTIGNGKSSLIVRVSLVTLKYLNLLKIITVYFRLIKKIQSSSWIHFCRIIREFLIIKSRHTIKVTIGVIKLINAIEFRGIFTGLGHELRLITIQEHVYKIKRHFRFFV